MPISLSDAELAIVMTARSRFAPKDRDKFLRDVAHQLSSHHHELGPGAVHRIVRETQRRYFDAPSFVGCSTPRWSR
jgi:hypothetical protein